MQTTSDEVLIGRIAGGDRLAMQVLFARHHVRVFRFVLRFVKNEATAEDLISEVFLDVWRQAGRFEGRSSVSTWLLSIARFKALSAVRKRTDVELDEETAEAIVDESDDPEATLAKKDKGAVLRDCMNALSAEHREIIDLVYYHEKSVEEVAAIVGIPEATVKTRMFYARKKLGELLKAAWGRSRLAMNTNMNTTNEPDDIETLLPWHAAGTLSPRDARRVEDALARDPELAKRYALVREELGEAIRLNESPRRAFDPRDGCAVQEDRCRAGAPAARLAQSRATRGGVLRLAVTAHAGVVGDRRGDRDPAAGRIAGRARSEQGGEPLAAIRPLPLLAPRRSTAASSWPGSRHRRVPPISPRFLQANNLAIVNGPVAGGLYRLRVSETKMPKEQLAERARQLQQDKRVELIAAVE